MSGGGGGILKVASLVTTPGLIANVQRIKAESDARAATNRQKEYMAQVNKPAVALPSMNSDAVQNKRISSLKSLQQRSGRASTLLTTQSPVKNTFG